MSDDKALVEDARALCAEWAKRSYASSDLSARAGVLDPAQYLITGDRLAWALARLAAALEARTGRDEGDWQEIVDNELQEVADGAWGGGPYTRGRAKAVIAERKAALEARDGRRRAHGAQRQVRPDDKSIKAKALEYLARQNLLSPLRDSADPSDQAALEWERINLPSRADVPFNLVDHLRRQKDFSERTFGPGQRTKGVVDHIRKELAEIEADPTDLMEWVDVIILAFDGAWRAGWEAQAIVDAIVAKQTRNEAREWPDWRTADPDKAIEHVRALKDKQP